MEFDQFKSESRQAIENELCHSLAATAATTVRFAAEYCLLGGGHRWRGLLALAAGMPFADNARQINLTAACGVEMIHAASMVLDDLPSMDNAEFRRSKPCVHRVFPRWAVDMVPGFLATLAYQTMLADHLIPTALRVQTALLIADAGLMMAQGQELDLHREGADHLSAENRLLACYRLKSAALYATAAKLGALQCGAGEVDADRVFQCGEWLGLAYQFLDDLADVEAEVADAGKNTGMDGDKITAVTLFGVDGTWQRSRDYQDRAVACLSAFDERADMMRQLALNASWAPA